ncbi:MAG: T9SS type A sorting domain-containing protein [Bacteroidetes bacterium]|nr:T9SS type A sorting domain-containing protein [Bacteroidota bacterium]
MKKIYKILVFILVLDYTGQSGFAQDIIAEYAVAIDTNKNGYYDAVEIRFSQPVNDTLFKLSLADNNWKYSKDGDYDPNSSEDFDVFNTKVEYIDGVTVNKDNDEYVRLGFRTDAVGDVPVSGSAKRWIKYTGDIAILDSTNTNTLQTFEDTIAWDKTSPIVISVTSSPSTSGDTLIVGNTLTFTVENAISEDSLVVSPITYNGGPLIWTKKPPYQATYEVQENDPDQWTPLQLLGVTLTDSTGNVSDSFDGSDVAWSIDANTPQISHITATTTSTKDTLIVGDEIIFTLIPEDAEEDLIVSQTTFNGGDLNWTTSDGSSYVAVYTVENNQTDLAPPLQLTNIALSDKAGNISVAKSSNAIQKSIDAHIPTISNVSFNRGDGDTLGIGDTLVVTITASEKSMTADTLIINNTYVPADSLKFSGGSFDYTFNYIISSGDNDIDDDTQAIPIHFVLADSVGNLSDPYTTSLEANCPGIDANRPDILSISFIPDNGTLAIDDSVRLRITVANAETDLKTDTISINEVNVKSTFKHLGNGVYRVHYKVSSVDQNIDDVAQALPAYIVLTDGVNNSDTINTTEIEETPGVDSNAPEINGSVSVYESGGVTASLVGDTIKFTLDVVVSEENLIVSPSTYNGHNLNWTTDDAGDTYYGIYVVTEGDQDRDADYDLTGVTLTDQAGNVSNVESGDITLRIDANTPEILSVTSDALIEDTLIAGGKIKFTVDIKTLEDDLDISPKKYNGVDITWSTEDLGSTYTATYTVADNNPDQFIPLQLTGVTATDSLGNVSNIVNGTDVSVAIDANSPYINGVTVSETANPLLVGDKVTFTIDVDSADASLSVTPAEYNNKDLNWFTNNGGDSYIGIYEVTEGDDDQSAALDLLNIKLTDPAGNESNTQTGDVIAPIDANTPTISSVRLLNKPKNIGDVDTLIVRISEINSDGYGLVSGKVAGFDISGIEKIDNDSLYAFFTIQETGVNISAAADIKIESLQVQDLEGNKSNIISPTISQTNDPIYGRKPEATISGNYRACDKDSVEILITLNGVAPYTIEIKEAGGTVYPPVVSNSNSYFWKVEADQTINTVMNFTITKVTDATGNSDAGLGSAQLTVDFLSEAVKIISPNDETRNINAVPDTLIGNFNNEGVFSGNGVSPTSKKFSPSIAGLGVHEIIYTYSENTCTDSDTTNITVIETKGDITFSGADNIYCNYESSFIAYGYNEDDEPLIDFRLSNNADSAMTINPADTSTTIYPTKLNEGTYQLTYIFGSAVIDSVTESFTIEKVNESINFNAIPNQCADYDTIFVNSVNRIPSGGTGAFTFSGPGDPFEYEPTDTRNNSGYLLPGQIASGNYNLEYVYTTPNGCQSNPVVKSFEIYALPNPSFAVGTETVYNIDQGSSIITGIPTDAGGTFTSTLGFIDDNGDGTAEIDPDETDLGSKIIVYTYINSNGCVEDDTLDITVNKALGDITSAQGTFQYCYYGSLTDTLTGTPNPTDNSPGSFYIDGNLIAPESDNKIVINPQDYLAGDHNVRFTYYNGTTEYFVEETINIDSIGNIYFTGLDNKYCEDENEEIELTAFYPGQDGSVLFSGSGITDDIDDNIAYFNPSNAGLNDNLITYTFTRDYSGCQKGFTKSTTVHNVPTVAFKPNEKCILGANSILGFRSDTLASDSVVNWQWRFGNITSNDTLAYFEVDPGYRTVNLKLETKYGCTNTIDSTFYIGTRIDIDFSFENECHGEAVQFELLNTSNPDDTISTNWIFGGDGEADFSDAERPTFSYKYPGEYEVIYEEFLRTCGRNADTLIINVRPSIDLSNEKYYQDFEEAPNITGWVVEDLDNNTKNNSWQWGVPEGNNIYTASSGQNAFVTNLSGDYELEESGMVTSPCFDFSGMKRPMIKLDIISFSEKDRDGAVLQYTKADGNWATIGVPNDGVSWYNSYIISGDPANQGLGWTDKIVSDDNNGWETAMYRLDELRGRAGVRFRVVFGSDAAGTGYEGFGFDNIQFGERKRVVLLENFTNITSTDALEILNDIDVELGKDSLDVIALNYHTSFPEANELNRLYPSGPAARALYYGISSVPYSVVDGINKFSYLSGQNLTESNIHKRMLLDPLFDILVEQNVQNNELIVSSEVKALQNLNDYKLSVFVAVVEKTVNIESEEHRNVLRTMIPDAAGTLVEKEWFTGDNVIVYDTWSIPDDVNQDSLMTIVFVQDEETKEIYQAEYADQFSAITSDNDLTDQNITSYSVYPNPSKEFIYINLNEVLLNEANVNIYDGIGKLMKSDIIPKGESSIRMDVKDLPAGIYYISLKSEKSDDVLGVTKLIKTE